MSEEKKSKGKREVLLSEDVQEIPITTTPIEPQTPAPKPKPKTQEPQKTEPGTG